MNLKPVILLGTFAAVLPAAGPNPPKLSTLQPGGVRNITQSLDVNVVFVGYEPGGGPQSIDETKFRTVLPKSYRPIHRSQAFYGDKQFVGLTFNFNYNLVYAPAAFETNFFNFLSATAVPANLTAYQTAYNAQLNRSQTIAANYEIPAVAVENWLAANSGALVDTKKYTIFYINWWGRPDFKHHVYVKRDEPDPDTGVNFGTRSSRALISWGGTAADDPESGNGQLRRIWFNDLSAGPHFWTDNWNVDNADVDGNGKLDYRMPPVWEYGSAKATYRPFDNLSGDLGKITRYVAIDLLFTTSPLYKPAISPPGLPSTIQVDVNLYQGDPGYDAKLSLKPMEVKKRVSPLQPQNTFSVQVSESNLTGRSASVYDCFRTYFTGPAPVGVSCFGNRLFGIAFGDPFLYHSDLLNQFIEGDADYEVPVFNYYATVPKGVGGLLGFADDNWRDGTQSFVFGFLNAQLRAAGYGFTITTIHEVGHHLGMSHPHDGYDFEQNIDFFSSDAFYFANHGDESNSIMSYIDLNSDFGQFDRDNMARYMTAHYINQANAVLASIYQSPRAGDVSSLLTAADANAAAALSLYGGMNYSGAMMSAKSAYQNVLAAAARINVTVEPQNYTADYKAKGRSPKFIDTVNYKRLAQ
jgi:hypothetical protein